MNSGIAVTEICNNKDYDGFLFLDSLIKGLDDGDLKTKLSDFDKEFKILRAESFMVGTWEWQLEGDEKRHLLKDASGLVFHPDQEHSNHQSARNDHFRFSA